MLCSPEEAHISRGVAVLLVLGHCSVEMKIGSNHFVNRRSLSAALLALSAMPPAAILPQPAAAAVTAEKVDPETGKLILLNPPSLDVVSNPPKVTSRCFLEVSIGGVKYLTPNNPNGRIEIELYGEVAPKAAENFRALCTGEKGFGYAGTTFFKVLAGLTIQGGDVDGKGLGRSIYGPTFAHDNYDIFHNVAGLVSSNRPQYSNRSHLSNRPGIPLPSSVLALAVVNSGVGGSSGQSDSRFLIQPNDDAGFLDGRYEAFGRVTSGLDVVQRINDVKVAGTKQAPIKAERVMIEAAGEIPMEAVAV